MKEPEKISKKPSKLSRLSYYCSILNIFIIAASIFYSIYIASQSCKFTHICERPLYELLFVSAAFLCTCISLIGLSLAYLSSNTEENADLHYHNLGMAWNLNIFIFINALYYIYCDNVTYIDLIGWAIFQWKLFK